MCDADTLLGALAVRSHATGRRSSRAIERACVDDVAVRVVAANLRPDHAKFNRRLDRFFAAAEPPPGPNGG